MFGHFTTLCMKGLKEITNLNSAKNGTLQNVLTRCLKEVADIYSSVLTQTWSIKTVNNKPFQTNLKLADVTLLEENYRPVSV